MEYCSHTQFKEQVINDNNMPLLGGAVITVPAYDGTNQITIRVTGSQSAKLISKADGTEIILSSSSGFVNTSLQEKTDFWFVSKYDAFPAPGVNNKFQGVVVRLEDFKFVNPEVLGFINLKNSDSEGNLEILPSSVYTKQINIQSCANIVGDLDAIITKFPNVGQNSGLFNTSDSGITGNVSALGKLLYIPTEFYLSALLEGDFYDAIVGWRTTIGATGSTGNMICGSKPHLWSVTPGKNKAFSLAWTSTTSSITVNGVTTTFDNSGNII